MVGQLWVVPVLILKLIIVKQQKKLCTNLNNNFTTLNIQCFALNYIMDLFAGHNAGVKSE